MTSPGRLLAVVLGVLAITAASARADAPATAGAHEHRSLAAPPGGEPFAGHARRDGPKTGEIAYSELNHRVAGGFVLLLGILAAGAAMRPHAGLTRSIGAVVWVLFGAYLFVTADPEAWPAGAGGLADVFADGLVLQHKLLSVIPVALGLVEGARAARRGVAVAWLIPVLALLGGAGLFLHGHEGGVHVDRTFVQHAVMGAAGVVTGGALLVIGRRPRWSTWKRWAWPALLAVTAAVLLRYVE